MRMVLVGTVAAGGSERAGVGQQKSAGQQVKGATMEVGDQVELHTRFNNSWVPGFEIARVVSAGYRVRRTSDGTLLPSFTSESDLRSAPPDDPDGRLFG